MYRVNAERSQEKNDHNERVHRCTKVTCATRARRKSSRDITTHSAAISHHVVSAARAFQKNARCDAGGIAWREPSRSFPPSIMRDDFQRRQLEGSRLNKHLKSVGERNHGRI